MDIKNKITKILAAGLLCGVCLTGTLYPVAAAAESLVGEQYVITDYCGESDFSVFKDKDGYLYASGSNAVGQLGRGTASAEKKLEPYEGKILNEKVTAFDTGKSGFVLAITEGGKLYGWGDNSNGQLAKEIDKETDENNYYGTPFCIDLPQDCKPISVNAGANHSLLLSEAGNVYAWGQNNRGQLGLSLEIKRTVRVTTPTMIPQSCFGGEKIIQIATTEATSFAVTQSGKLYSWGDSDYGQMGDGIAHPIDNARPDLINAPVATLLTDVVKVSAQGKTAMALTKNGDVYVWGNNNFKQFGSPEWEERMSAQFADDKQNAELAIAWSSVPVQIENVYDINGQKVQAEFQDILCGGTTNFILSKDGDVYSFGTGGSGELGFSVVEAEKTSPYATAPKMAVPTKVTFYQPLSIESITENEDEALMGKTPADMTSVQEVNVTKLINSIGVRTFVMDDAGNVWSWGDNADGLVSSGNVASTDIPVLSTLFRDKDYDVTIQEKNYLLEPSIGLAVIYGTGIVLLIVTEIKNAKQKKLATK